MLSIAATVMGSVLMMPVQALIGSIADLPVWYPLIQALFWPLFLSAAMGSSAAKTDGAGLGAISPFQAIKPITTSQIIFIKMRIGMIAIVLGWIAAVAPVLALAQWPKWRELCLNSDFQAMGRWLLADTPGLFWLLGMMLLSMLMGWHGMILSMTLSLSGRGSVIPWRAMGWLTSLPLMTGAGLYLYRRPELAGRMEPFIWAGLALFLGWRLTSTVRAFSKACRRTLWTHGQLRVGLALWLLLAGGFVAGVLLCHWKLSVPTELVLLATAGLWPGGELARAVINLANHRHQ
jgi:hypothetical protein